MSKTKMQEARELIRAARYNEAREILKAIDHPMAREWLQKLDKIAPDTRQKNYYAGEGAGNHPYDSSVGETNEWARQSAEMQATYNKVRDKEQKQKRQQANIALGMAIGRVFLEALVVFVCSFIGTLIYMALSGSIFCLCPGIIPIGLIIGYPLRRISHSRGQAYHVVLVVAGAYLSVVFARYIIFLIDNRVNLNFLGLLPFWNNFTDDFFKYVTQEDLVLATLGAFIAVGLIWFNFRELK